MKFVVYGDPIPKARPRMTKNGHCFTPKETKLFEFLVQQVWNGIPDKRKIVAPTGIAIQIAFHLKRGKTVKRTQHTTRPDLDNMIKSVCDGLNGHAWTDDGQIVSILASKEYVKLGEKPRTEIIIVEDGCLQ